MRIVALLLCLIVCVASATEQRWQIVQEEVEAGRRLGSSGPARSVDDLFEVRQPRRSVDEVFWNARKGLGSWFDGTRMRPIEWAIHLDQNLFSRWLGFLQAREHWGDDELEYRWNQIEQFYGSGEWFLIQLSAFPKQQVFDLEPRRRPDFSELHSIRIVATEDRDELVTEHYPLGSIRRRSAEDALSHPWHFYLPHSEYLTWEFQTPGRRTPNLGEYGLAWHLVRVIPRDETETVTLRVLSERKERNARFELGKNPVKTAEK